MGKQRIALCITDLDRGGAENALVELATRLDSARFEPVVYCLGPRPVDEEASCVPPLEAAGIAVHCLGARGVRDSFRVVRELRRLLRLHSPHLLQTFLFHANLVGRIAARRAGVRPVVCGIRVAERRARWHLWADRLTARLVDHYVCVSHSVAAFSQAEGGLRADRLTVIPNGVEVGRYPAEQKTDLAQFGIPNGGRAIAFVGRLDAQKGLAWLLEALPQIFAQLPDHHLLLVGKGPEKSNLEQLAHRHGVSSRVHFAGWRPDVPGILAACDLLVLPSRWEGMPNVVLEAMASRLPVTVTDVEGVREILGRQAEGQVVPFGDIAALASAITRILTDPALAATLGEENRRRVEQQFSWERTVRAYQDLWLSLLSG